MRRKKKQTTKSTNQRESSARHSVLLGNSANESDLADSCHPTNIISNLEK